MSGRFWDASDASADIAAAIDDLIDEHVKEALNYFLTENEDADTLYVYMPMEFYPSDGFRGPAAPPAALTVRCYIEGIEAYMDVDFGAKLRESAAQCAEDGSYREGLTRIADEMESVLTVLRAAIQASAGKQ